MPPFFHVCQCQDLGCVNRKYQTSSGSFEVGMAFKSSNSYAKHQEERNRKAQMVISSNNPLNIGSSRSTETVSCISIVQCEN